MEPGEYQMDEVMIPIAMFAMIAAIVIVPTWLKSKERRDMQVTLRASIEKGQALPPEVIDALTRQTIKPPATAGRDLRIGVILLALSLGIGVTSPSSPIRSASPRPGASVPSPPSRVLSVWPSSS
jgi:hypothetical protein